MKNFRRRHAPLFILKGAAMILIVGGVTMLLWNALIPAIFHLGTITYLQALGILLLSKILFGFRGGRRGGGRFFKMRMMQKWQNMTPEEQEKFKGNWGEGRCQAC